MRSTARKQRKGADPVYVAEDATTGHYLKLDGERSEQVDLADATTFPATHAGRLEAFRVLSLAERALCAELVRIDAL